LLHTHNKVQPLPKKIRRLNQLPSTEYSNKFPSLVRRGQGWLEHECLLIVLLRLDRMTCHEPTDHPPQLPENHRSGSRSAGDGARAARTTGFRSFLGFFNDAYRAGLV